MALYRDSKGRIRNSDQITKANQEKLYKGLNLDVKPVFVQEVTTRKVKGKKITYPRKIVYVDSEGNRATKKEFKRFNYLRNLSPDKGVIIHTEEAQRWDVLPIIKNAVLKGNNVKIDGKKVDPSNIYKIIKEIREKIKGAEKNGAGEYDIIFYVEEDELGNLIIISANEDE